VSTGFAGTFAAVHLVGTLVNVATVIVGTAIGTLLGDRLPERVRETVMHGLGLFVIALGVVEAGEAFSGPLADFTRGSAVVVLGSILVGGVIGELIGIEQWLTRMGDRLRDRFARGEGDDGEGDRVGDDPRASSRFTEGFVVASLVFCVGPLAVLGSIQDGLSGDAQLLIIKSVLDGFAALAFSAALGWGVGFSVITIVVYQGTLSLAAGAVADGFSDAMISSLTATGGILILAIGLRLLDVKRIRVANLLPALVLAPATVAVMQALQ
jgi:uncharacterized membrane protein YqgA involved in biofilm formation